MQGAENTMVKLTWKKEDKHGSIYAGYANDVKLFEIIMLADGTMLSYVLSSSLPGIDSIERNDRNTLMRIAAARLDNWIERIGVEAVLK